MVETLAFEAIYPGGCAPVVLGGAPLRELGADSFDRRVNVPDDKCARNIAENIKLGHQEFAPAIVHNDSEICIVGSGPTVAHFAEEIRTEQARGVPIIAVKGAHDWLFELGITPDLCVVMDAQDKIIIKHKNPGCIYLLASQVSPMLFAHLSDCKVIVWHALADIGEDEVLGPGRIKIGGGSTSGLRAMSIAYLMGFKKIILYGFDSCLDGRTKRVDGTEAENVMPVRTNDRWFQCNGAMAAQAAEFQERFSRMPGLKVRVMGDSLLAALMQERKALGSDDTF